MRRIVVALFLAAAAPAAVGTQAAIGTASGSTPGIVAVAPNPTAAGDRGEYLVVSVPADTDLSGWSIDDGETTARFPNRTASGRMTVTADPGAIGNWTPRPVVALRGRLRLANGGETVRLRRGGETVDSVRYGRAPEGEVYVRSDGGWRWRPAGATDLPVVSASDVQVRAFVLPDSPGEPVVPLVAARERILLAAYTLTSRRVADALCAARGRGVRVEVLVEGEPVGGLVRREARLLDRLAACGVRVRVLGGPHARYSFHHAKYAVVDDRALVLTENWKPAGTGGRSSRGWGVLVDDPRVASTLAGTFGADAGFRDAVPWSRFRAGRSFAPADEPPASGRYPARFEPRTLRAARVEVLVAPDNAEEAVVALLDGARESIVVQQMSLGSADGPFASALLRAARRGVHVRLLLSGAWYVRDENRRIAARLEERARREGLALRVRLAAPRSRFEKTHVKGAVVDDEVALVGSMNWNPTSARENREVAVLVHGEAVAGYYARVFRADWRGGVWRLPVGAAAVAVSAVVVAGWAGRRAIRFEGSGRVGASGRFEEVDGFEDGGGAVEDSGTPGSESGESIRWR